MVELDRPSVVEQSSPTIPTKEDDNDKELSSSCPQIQQINEKLRIFALLLKAFNGGNLYPPELKMPSHKTFMIMKKLAKKQRQNRPIPYWIRLLTDNTIRYNVKRRHWRRTKLAFFYRLYFIFCFCFSLGLNVFGNIDTLIAKKAREWVMELLLINHLFDCQFVIILESAISKISVWLVVLIKVDLLNSKDQ
ncbi:Uncharacterized protein Fot_27874 [Forsythia ovata]|uniref:60S ribosomal protein L39 n=1 Tax=Forsythia ovata TaxID=205694 RepID=A0ABD1TMW1_9LAMI